MTCSRETVWSWREESGEIVLSEVVETFVRADQPLLAVTIGAASTAQETIKSTTEHPYWTQRGWVAARELTTADQVLSRSGEWLSVLSVIELAEKSTVYNFEVKGSHSYFVGEQGVLVHNVSRINGILGRPVLHDHHLLPQTFRRFFEKVGIDIEQHTVTLSEAQHLKGIHGRGLAELPGRWNQRWAEWIPANPNASAKDIYQQLGRMMDEYGLSSLRIHPYGK